MDLIEIFKAGTHTDSSGNTREWTDNDLEEIASLYDPTKHEAPIVIGHPDHDSPAYGWVESLKVEGGKLLAKVKDVAEEFKDWVGRGLYKKISIALYPDLSLRHVGFLGAMPPAVKGLKQAMFSEKPAWEIETDLGTPPNFSHRINSNDKNWEVSPGEVSPSAAAVTQSLSSDPNKKGGKKIMDVTKFFSDLKAMVIGAEKELTPDPGGAKFTEAEVQAREKKVKEDIEKIAFAEMEKLKKEKADLEKEKTDAAARVKAIEDQARKDGIHAFCEVQAKAGQLIPAWTKMGIEEFLFNLDSDVENGSQPFRFAEGVEKTRAQWFKGFLTELPKVVTFKKVAGGEGPGSGGSAAEKLSALIKQKMEAKKDLSYGAAFSEVQKENSELAREIAEEMRGNREKK